MKSIKCNFKNLTELDKNQFKYSECLLLISVGQESHEGERFLRTIELVNNSFKSCIISLYDSIQRHTLALSSINPPTDFHMTANKEGDLWLERNKPYYEALSIPTKIFRWDQWLTHSFYQNTRKQLLTLIKKDTSYSLTFEQTINKYLDRYCKNLSDHTLFNRARAEEICFEYILEECAVLCLWQKLNCPYEIYPNAHNDAIEETRKRFIHAHNPSILKPLTLRFRNAAQLKPQNFVLDLLEENSV